MYADAAVEGYWQELEHPLKEALLETYRILCVADPRLEARIKWKVPSFYYGRYDFAAFHPRSQHCVHLVVVYPRGAVIANPTGLLEGTYLDRRMIKLGSLAEVQRRAEDLRQVVADWFASLEAPRSPSPSATSPNLPAP